jgi:hypothetical protein
MEDYREKRVGRRKDFLPGIAEADRWLKTVQELRGGKGVCRKGLYKFKTFEEADQWMEEMILSTSIRESQP